MVRISLLTEAFEVSGGREEVLAECRKNLGQEPQELFRLQKVEEEEFGAEVVVKIPSNLNIGEIEEVLEHKDLLEIQLQRAKEALQAYEVELSKLKEKLSLKKTQRIKNLELENKKLKETFR